MKSFKQVLKSFNQALKWFNQVWKSTNQVLKCASAGFQTVPPHCQWQNTKKITQPTSSFFYIENVLKKWLFFAAIRFWFWYWRLVESVKKTPCINSMTNIGCDSQPLLGFILHCYQHVYICFDFWLVTWRMFLVIWRFVRQMPDGNHCFWKSWLLTKYQFLEPGTLAWPSRLSYFRFHWWQSSTLYLSILVHHPTIEIAKKCVNLHRVNILHYKIIHRL